MRDTATCRLGIVLYPLDVCAEQYQIPGLFGVVMAGLDPAEAEP